MNQKLEKIRDEAWENYKEKNPPKGQASLYYKDNAEYWKAGFNSAEPHIRQDEQEKILDILEKFVDEDEYHQIERAIRKGKQDE